MNNCLSNSLSKKNNNLAIKFPLGIASGEYFCNRISETNLLVNNIKKGVHTVLISPRRYGKTSLAYRAIDKSGFVNAKVDLFMATSQQDVAKSILSAIDHLLSQVRSTTEEILNVFKTYIKTLKPVLEAGSGGFKVRLDLRSDTVINESIKEGLQILDAVLQKKSMQAVLLIDEFQELQKIAPKSGIDGVIRHIAQETKSISFVFSGSHRNMLQSMFNDRAKPLYRLCDEIHLDRIQGRDYKPFMDSFAQSRWRQSFPKDVLAKIMEYTQAHPYYFNFISSKLFDVDNIPGVQDVTLIWQGLLVKKRQDLLVEMRVLNLNHKKIMVAIANGINTGLTSHSFIAKCAVPSATIIRCLEFLQQNDFIAKNEDTQKYFIIDPLLKWMLSTQVYI